MAASTHTPPLFMIGVHPQCGCHTCGANVKLRSTMVFTVIHDRTVAHSLEDSASKLKRFIMHELQFDLHVFSHHQSTNSALQGLVSDNHKPSTQETLRAVGQYWGAFGLYGSTDALNKPSY